jgi:hypothetical protein
MLFRCHLSEKVTLPLVERTYVCLYILPGALHEVHYLCACNTGVQLTMCTICSSGSNYICVTVLLRQALRTNAQQRALRIHTTVTFHENECMGNYEVE